MSVSLYRKYRPQDFASVVGQKAAVEILTSSIEKSRVGHAYLFSGSRGCGKTSVARIFAKALDCLDPQGYEPCGKCRNCEAITAGDSLDVIEIDGASNNGVENIRGLKENVTLAPFNSKYKIYIIDEVHMLSTGAFNALLKTLEEPPEYVIFIMATTEPHKVPVTIRSRCQHIPFHSISPEDILSRLEYVCEHEGITAERDALWEIARQADGALRDALSLLEQVTAAGDVTLAQVESVLGVGSRPAFERWLRTLRQNPEEAYTSLKAMFDGGASGVRVFEEMFSLVRNLWLVSRWKSIADSLGLSASEKEFLLSEAANWKSEKLHSLLGVIMKMLTHSRQNMRPDILLGMFMLYLEPAPQIAPEVRPIAAEYASHPPARILGGTQQAVLPSPKPEPAMPNQLKAKLLEAAHAKDFALCCAMLDSVPAENEGILKLDMQHAYCFDFMKRNEVLLVSTFTDYRGIVIQHGSEKHMYVIENRTPVKEVPAVQPVAPVMPNVELDITPPKARTLSTRNKPSPFDELKHRFIQLGAKPELLYVKSLEAQEDNDNNEDNPEGGTEA